MLKRVTIVFFSSLLKITLFSLALAGAGWIVFGTPDNIKDAAESSGIYSSSVDNILKTAKDEALKGNAQLPLDNPEIEAAAKQAFPPELLSSNSESIINGFYAWLQGESETPQFAVDLTDAKQKFANNVAGYAQRRYESLPPCTMAQLQTINPDAVDAFSVNCRPPGLAGSSVREKVRADILASEDFIQTTEFTAENLPKDEQGRTVTENLSAAPDAYDIFKVMPWVLAGLSAAFAAIILLLHDDRRKGMKSIGITLVGTGIFIMLGALIINFVFGQMNQPSDAFQASVASLFKSLASDYVVALRWFYITYILIGAIILLTLRRFSDEHKK